MPPKSTAPVAPSKGAKKLVSTSKPPEQTKAKADGTKKRYKKRKKSYAIYNYKELKQLHPDTVISSKAMSIMNSFLNDIFERIANEASKLATHNGKLTISSREIQTSVHLILADELAKHAVSEGH